MSIVLLPSENRYIHEITRTYQLYLLLVYLGGGFGAFLLFIMSSPVPELMQSQF